MGAYCVLDDCVGSMVVTQYMSFVLQLDYAGVVGFVLVLFLTVRDFCAESMLWCCTLL